MKPEFVVKLKGKEHVLYAGLLDAATQAGLRSLCTTVLQVPSPENGHTAVVLARARFEDGREFEDVGDCSPANCSPQIATAALRMASTRAKGRCLRDALNITAELLEDAPDTRSSAGTGSAERAPAAGKPKNAPSGTENRTKPPAGRPLQPTPQRVRHDPIDHATTTGRCPNPPMVGQAAVEPPARADDNEPMTEEQRQFLRELAAKKGAIGANWLPAIDHIRTRRDGRILREGLLALPDDPPLGAPMEARSLPNAQRQGY
jgi:hypothetical protein